VFASKARKAERGVRHSRRALSAASAALSVFLAVAATAQPHPVDAGSCEPLVRQLQSSKKEAERAHNEAQACERKVTECTADLATDATLVQQSQEVAKTCQDRQVRLCSATAALVDELARGRAAGAIETGCVNAEQQARLDAIMTGWAGTTVWLGQLAAYQSGETDAVPRARAGSTALERAAQRVVRNAGGRAFHRRLLVEAIELVAPRAWTRIRTRGSASVDAWFSASAPLDPDVVAEAQHAQPGPMSAGGPPLAAALHLVRAFKVAARCSPSATDGRECARAQQLEQLLESSGSLVLRRRVQEIWATECSVIAPETVTSWIEDFPTAHGAPAAAPWHEIAENAYAKLFACYLDDSSEHTPYGPWLKEKLPAATKLTAARLERVDAIRARWDETSREAACARAVRAMQTFSLPSTCSVPTGDFRSALETWSAAADNLENAEMPLAMCTQFARLLWDGKAASIDGSFARPPSLDEMVVAKPLPPTSMWRLRAHCDERRGTDEFARDILVLGALARRFGEGVESPPFRLDPATSKPVELVRFEASRGAGPWLAHVVQGVGACSVLGLGPDRCQTCTELAPMATYDCELVARLDAAWAKRTRAWLLALGVFGLTIAFGIWLRRLLRARTVYASWSREAATFFDGIGLSSRKDAWRFLFPSRHDSLELKLPSAPAWERWGASAAVVGVPEGPRVLERHVNHAAFVARRWNASVVLLEHDDNAALDLSAVRAMLEWAAKGGSRAVQVLPIGVSRARWSKTAHDVLDLVEESSLRGNPFELRGRIATSNQFFNRERLVSGLLAAAQAGHWVVLTGLRRFGKSSLALEVARRIPGPSAYVDVAAFDHEMVSEKDPSVAAEAILRFVCVRLVESARERWPARDVPAPPADEASLDVATLTHWMREFSRACRGASGHSSTMLIVLDELEQALAVGPDRLAHALDILAIVLGRLKGAVGDAAMPDGGSAIGVFLTSALHPLLWAPLRTLAHQSIMGAFQRVCVPSLAEDAATTMMRSLGGRQGIRFTDEAVARIVRESQGVPLLLRRIGGAILELYDAERARQGSLGAVEVGIRGTEEAIQREEQGGSPLRVWIETEIAAPSSVTGALLRKLAREQVVGLSELWALAKQRVTEDFLRTGISATLAPDEVARRSEEAAHVIVRLLEDTRLLIPHGDLTSPDGYSLPDGVIRRVLSGRSSVRPEAMSSAVL
jgi:hypothetical protein